MDEITAQRQQVNGCARSHGVRTHPKEWVTLTKSFSGLVGICSGRQPGTSH